MMIPPPAAADKPLDAKDALLPLLVWPNVDTLQLMYEADNNRNNDDYDSCCRVITQRMIAIRHIVLLTKPFSNRFFCSLFARRIIVPSMSTITHITTRMVEPSSTNNEPWLTLEPCVADADWYAYDMHMNQLPNGIHSLSIGVGHQLHMSQQQHDDTSMVLSPPIYEQLYHLHYGSEQMDHATWLTILRCAGTSLRTLSQYYLSLADLGYFHQYATNLQSLSLQRFRDTDVPTTTIIGAGQAHTNDSIAIVARMTQLHHLAIDWTPLARVATHSLVTDDNDNIWYQLRSLTQLRSLIIMGSLTRTRSSLRELILYLSSSTSLSGDTCNNGQLILVNHQPVDQWLAIVPH